MLDVAAAHGRKGEDEPRRSGPLRLVDLATTPEAIRRVMTRAGLVAMPPPPSLPVVRRQLELGLASTC